MWLGAMLVEVQAISIGLLVLSVALPGLGLIYFYLEWRNDAVIVTDQRIIRITRTILALHRHVTQVGMQSIHEINFEIPPYDPFARLFRYGTVIVKTAGAQGNLELPLLPNPESFQKLIMEDRQYFENRQAQRHNKLVRAEMERWLDGVSPDEEIKSTADEPPRPITQQQRLPQHEDRHEQWRYRIPQTHQRLGAAHGPSPSYYGGWFRRPRALVHSH